MGLIQSFDPDIRDIVSEPQAGFVSADRVTRLMIANTEARQELSDAHDRIRELQRKVAEAATVQGIVNATRALNSDYVTPGDMATILGAAGGLCNRLVKFGWRELQPAVEEIDWATLRCQDEQNSRDAVDVEGA